MRSRAHIKGHPIHTMLIAFPIAFFAVTPLADLTGYFGGNELFFQLAYYLQAGGVLFGILAAIAGIVDLVYTIPPRSSAKKRGITHGLLNTSSLLVHLFVWLARDADREADLYLIALELLAVMAMIVAGWMGGTLVYRNQIGVNPRYAGAGKWKEVYPSQKGEGYPVPEAKDLALNQMLLVHVNGKRIVIARTEKGLAAFDDSCPHKGGSLAGGSIACSTVQCPWHGNQFDVHDGRVTIGPSKEGIAAYTIEESGDAVYLKL